MQDLRNQIHTILALAKEDPASQNSERFRHVIDMQSKLLDRLQAFADARVEYDILPWITSSIFSAETAVWAESLFDRTYLNNLPYSEERLSVIADTLKNACAPWLGVNPLWEAVSNGNMSVLFLDEEDPDANELQDLK